MKLHIFGASGAGVTTLGQALSTHLRVPYFDSDVYYWEDTAVPFTVRRDPAERNALLKADLQQKADWILGGSVINWGVDWGPVFDLAVFLWIPTAIRVARLKERELERYGTVIFSSPARSQLFTEFIEWASGYDDGSARGRTLKAHEAWLSTLTCPVLELRGDLTVDQRVDLVLAKLADQIP